MADEGLLLVCPEQQVPPNVAQIHSVVAVNPPNDVALSQFNNGDEQHMSRQSDQTLPGSEGAELCSDRFVAVFGPHQNLEDFKFLECANVKVECAKTLDSFQLALSKVLAPLTVKTELWFFHLLLVDINNSLIMDGKAVSENEAYKLIHSRDLSRVSIFQFALRLPVELAKFNEAAPFWNKSQMEARQRRCCSRRRSSVCGCLSIYNFDIEKADDWPSLLNTLSDLVSRASVEADFTDEEAARVLSQSGCLTLRQESGCPDGITVKQLEPRQRGNDFRLPDERQQQQQQQQQNQQENHDPLGFELNQQPVQATEFNEITQQVGESEGIGLSDQVLQPRDDQMAQWDSYSSVLSPATSMPEYHLHPVQYAREKNAAIGLVIEKYRFSVDNKYYDDRLCSSSDRKIITNISELMLCRKDNVHLNSDHSHVSKHCISTFIQHFLATYKQEENLLELLLVFVSAHGSQEGIVTSAGEEIPLKDLLQPLQQVANHVLLFYQPCRGSLEHSVDAPKVPDVSGLSFPGKDMAGCCLPENGLQNVSAIFASMPGYVSYRSDSGSLMLVALRSVLQDVVGKKISQKQLAQLTQKKIHTMWPEGLQTSQQFEYAQVNYAVRQIYQITVAADLPVHPEV